MQLAKYEAERHYNDTVATPPQGIGATRTSLQRLLRSIDFVGWSRNEESGRLDRRALTKFAAGSASVFSRREHKESETSAVSVLVDCSGSMKGRRIRIASEFAIHLSKLLHQCRVPFAVTGFRSGTITTLGGDAVIETPTFLPFKQWGKTFQQSALLLGAIPQCAIGSTPDYSAIANSIDELSVRHESRRILFILTDAEGYNEQHMTHLQKHADKVGVTIVAIGIHADDVVRCFVNSVSVSDLADLGKSSFNQLLKAVQRKR
jgi:cobaltochelatase CobT